MDRRPWRKFTSRVASAIFSPAPDPRLMTGAGARLLAALKRIDAALDAVEETRANLGGRIESSQQRLAAFEREVERVEAAAVDDDYRELLRGRCRLAAREARLIQASIESLNSESQRLRLVRDRLTLQAETVALRRQVADARRSAAEARFDASDSVLDLSYSGGAIDSELEDVERRAADAEAKANAIESLLNEVGGLDE